MRPRESWSQSRLRNVAATAQRIRSTLVVPPPVVSELTHESALGISNLDNDRRESISTPSAAYQSIDYNYQLNNTNPLPHYLQDGMSHSSVAVGISSEDVGLNQAGFEQLIGPEQSGYYGRGIHEFPRRFGVEEVNQAPQPHQLPSYEPILPVNMVTYLDAIYVPGRGPSQNYMPAAIPYGQNFAWSMQRNPELDVGATKVDFIQQLMGPLETGQYGTSNETPEYPRLLTSELVNQPPQPDQFQDLSFSSLSYVTISESYIPYRHNMEPPIQEDPVSGMRADFEQAMTLQERDPYGTSFGTRESLGPVMSEVVNQLPQPDQFPGCHSSSSENVLNSTNRVYASSLGAPRAPLRQYKERRHQSQRKESWFKCRFKSCSNRKAERSDNFRNHLKMNHAKELRNGLKVEPDKIPSGMRLTKIINCFKRDHADLWRVSPPKKAGYYKALLFR
ncbi:hypothetical protein BDZ91DRAFT_799272 [Kalaharituber pfeilii]|nr:hypothetical protein BDZ91DRAFT_799272 [Kalaharituber pfeilii]